jgi:molecular chaperone GrpE (heat shock protein)
VASKSRKTTRKSKAKSGVSKVRKSKKVLELERKVKRLEKKKKELEAKLKQKRKRKRSRFKKIVKQTPIRLISRSLPIRYRRDMLEEASLKLMAEGWDADQLYLELAHAFDLSPREVFSCLMGSPEVA